MSQEANSQRIKQRAPVDWPLAIGFWLPLAIGCWLLAVPLRAQITITVPAPPVTIVGSPYAIGLSAEGGTAPYIFSVSSGTLPGASWSTVVISDKDLITAVPGATSQVAWASLSLRVVCP